MEGFRTQCKTHHVGKQITVPKNGEKQDGETADTELNLESQQKIKDILAEKLSDVADIPFLANVIKRPIAIYKNGKLFDIIGTDLPGEPVPVAYDPAGVGHWAPLDKNIQVNSSGPNNCLQDALIAQLRAKACKELKIQSAKKLRELAAKEIANNPALSNQFMEQAAKLNMLKPQAMMVGGRKNKNTGKRHELKQDAANYIVDGVD